MTPVEELVAALRRAEWHVAARCQELGERRQPYGEAAEAVRDIQDALSRFNAERADGVWVPREPTEAMCKAGSIKTRNEGQDASGRRTTRFLHPEVIGAAYRAMIAASKTTASITERKT